MVMVMVDTGRSTAAAAAAAAGTGIATAAAATMMGAAPVVAAWDPFHSSTGNQTELAQMYVNVITNTGLSASIVLLVIHLTVFALVDDLRNLPGKNLASFCTALLLEYASTLLSGALQGTACYANEIAAYYFIMASAFWMLTMSFDVWQTLRSSATELVLSASSGVAQQRRKFLVYSAWSWSMPALLTVLVFFVLPRVFSDFDLDFQDFDRKECSFRETDTMYKFVVSVFGTILLANTFFFAASVYYIFSTQAAVSRATANSTSGGGGGGGNAAFARHFQLYARLSLIMGVTWTAEFVIYYSTFDILSVTFKIINTFEGFFIVLAFTCRKQVLHNVKSLHIAKSLKDSTFHRYMSLRRLQA